MKNTAMFIIAVCGLGLCVPLASAEDDVLKKMRAFKAVMDTLPESTDPQEEEPQVPPAVTPAPVKKPAEVPAARETYPWQEDYSQPQKKDKTEQRPDASGAAEDRWTPYKGYTPPLNDMTADDAEEDAADMTEDAEDALPWESADTDDEDEDMTATEMAEDESPEPDMAEETTDASSGDEEAGSEVSAGDEDGPLPDMTEENAEDVGGESLTEERTVEESAYEWEEDVTEMEMDADTEQTAQEIKAMLESGIRKDVIAETEAGGLR